MYAFYVIFRNNLHKLKMNVYPYVLFYVYKLVPYTYFYNYFELILCIIEGPKSLLADPNVQTPYFEKAIMFLQNSLYTEGFVLRKSSGPVLMGTHTEKASGQECQRLY